MKDNEATNPIQWYLEGFRHYVDFRGRTGRRGYWYFFLFNFLVTLVLGAVSGALVSAYVLAAFLPGLAVFVRRLHDADRSAWWILIGLIPLLGSIVLLVFLVTEGTRGENDHGPDPRLAPIPEDTPASTVTDS
ncbi:MAG: hypothetical protein CME23_06715 [Gemmatimonadetes bacterium]|jgi:uncharacterized membrane protein YhaH (DUF805 family)|nr:hypothetical protein [Gemmatimonadota bacterium]|tara:strand:- start:993 stop:1391 length:399 start_codon:yes stop_codon:yes gene_type:complete